MAISKWPGEYGVMPYESASWRYRLASWLTLKLVGGWWPREINPPAGRIWVSDGERVWYIHTDGNGIDATATACKYWAAYPQPDPPLPFNGETTRG